MKGVGMISKMCFSAPWIAKQRELYPKADPHLIERQIYAFELVGLLAGSGRSFVFKGGTSLLLLLPAAHRLSIDVDIVGDFSIDELVPLSKAGVFVRVEEDKRKESRIPKKHFKFFYLSSIDKNESYVLLDVLYSEHGYPRLQKVPIQCAIFQVDEKLDVDTPTTNGILGDKLTAYAPNTIGVPFGKQKSMEIVKQLFDIGELFGACDDVSEAGLSYNSLQRQECAYRQSAATVDETLSDSIETSFLLCQSQLKGSIDNEDIRELHRGIKQIKSYLLGKPYRIEDARLSAAKAAYIATAIQKRKEKIKLIDIRYGDTKIQDLAQVTLEGKLSILNKLKATQTEAFYYWWLISRM
jgi:hypothetical protein